MPSTADDWPRDALTRGTDLYGYRIEEILGRGGFGITYRALDRIEQLFAIKECFPRQFAVRQGSQVLPTDAAAADSLNECLDRFTREAKGLLQLSRLGAAGDGVVKVNTSFETNSTAYIVMELVTGGSLETLIKANPWGVAEERLSAILPALLHAVGCAHDAGLLHRDIKPSNILLREDGRPVLIDFGAVRNLGVGRAHTFTQVFSEGYAPIEQITGAPQGPYSDIYSVGATFYRAIGGKTIDALSRHMALAAGKPDPLVPAVRLGAGRYREPLLKAIDAALHVAAEDRPQTVRDLMALTDASSGDDATVTRVRSRPPDATETRRRGPTPPPVDASVEEAERNKPRAGRAGRGGEARAAKRSKPRRAARIAIALGSLAVVILFALARSEYRRETAAPLLPTHALRPAKSSSPMQPPSARTAAPPSATTAAQALARAEDAHRHNDYSDAMRWSRRAADQGNATAQFLMGVMYASGDGVPRDPRKARKWMQKAAAGGYNPARSWLAAHKLTPEPGLLDIRTEPPGAAIQLDGRSLGSAPFIQKIAPGEHHLQASLPGYQPKSLALNLQPGKTLPEDLKLAPLPALVDIRTEPPGATLRLDGKSVGSGLHFRKIAPGHHRLEASLPGYRPKSLLFNLQPGGTFSEIVTLAPEPSHLDIRSEPRGAVIAVDGKPAGRAPLQLKIAPGEHSIRAASNGYEPKSLSVDPRPGETVSEDMKLAAIPAKLTVRTTPRGASILVDGKSVGTAPVEREIAPGRHVVRASLNDYEPKSLVVNAEPGRNLPLRLRLIGIPNRQQNTAPRNVPERGTKATLTVAPKKPLAVAPEPIGAELKGWRAIAASSNPEDFWAFLYRFPRGRFAGRARKRIAALQAPWDGVWVGRWGGQRPARIVVSNGEVQEYDYFGKPQYGPYQTTISGNKLSFGILRIFKIMLLNTKFGYAAASYTGKDGWANGTFKKQ